MAEIESTELDDAIASISGLSDSELVIAALGRLAEGGNISAASIATGFAQRFALYEGDQLVTPYWRWRYQPEETTIGDLNLDLLAGAASHSGASDFLRGHVGHLLWSLAPSGDLVQTARDAVAALLRLAVDNEVAASQRSQFAVQAHYLAKRLKDLPAQQNAVQALNDVLTGLLTSSDEPGTFLRTAAQLRRLAGKSASLTEMLAEAINTYASNSLLREQLVMLLASSVSNQRALEELGAEVSRLLDEAAGQPGFLREETIRRALRLARTSGLKELAGKASTALASMRPEDFDFKEHEIPVSIQGEERTGLRDLHSQFASDPDVFSMWATWCAQFPPFVPHESREPYQPSLADQIATITVVSPGGHVIFQPRTPEELQTYRFKEDDGRYLSLIYGFITGPGLSVLLSRPDMLDELERLIDVSTLFSTKGKARIRRALAAFRAGDWDGVLDCIPTIETAVRRLAVSVDVSIYSPNGSANVFKTLGGLLADLKQGLDTGPARFVDFWEYCLTDQLGMNIRNDYLHGIEEEGSQYSATMVFQIFVQLLLIVPISDAEPEAPGDDD